MEEWITSSYCRGNGCLAVHWHHTDGCEAGAYNGKVLVRATRGGPVLTFTPTEWGAFIDGCRGGEFDLAVLAR